MSNRLNHAAPRRSGIPPALGAQGWTTPDYLLAAWFAWPLIAASPFLIAPPLWASLMMRDP
jgi:hypothetical protein